MPKPTRRKTERGHTPRDVFERAANAVISGQTVRSVARDFDINRMTLHRYMNKKKENPHPDINYEKVSKIRQVFDEKMEAELADYVKCIAKQFYGLSKTKCLQLAYEFAKRNQLKRPANWDENKAAGQDWWLAFKKRNHLALRSPEATSRGRASAFNRHNVNMFFDNLAEVMDRFKFTADRIYNADESGCTTVQQPRHVVAEQGIKQVGSITTAERGELVTVVYTIRTDGVALPPMMIFPRVNYKNHFIRGSPPGSIGAATKSGWINEDIFVRYLDHIVAYSHCTKEKKILLILDNHEAHISLQAIDKARDSGIVMVTIPPHTSHRMQPLDVSVFFSFKNGYNTSMDNWVRSHPDKTVTIYDIPEFVNEAHLSAMTPRNIISGFKTTGIYPFNRDIFSDDDFAPSQVTDRPEPGNANERELDGLDLPEEVSHYAASLTDESPDVQPCALQISDDNIARPQNTHPEASNSNDQIDTGDSSQPTTSGQDAVNDQPSDLILPSEILAYPKAGPRKLTKSSRRQGSTKILTNTPVRDEIALAMQIREQKKSKNARNAKKALFVTVPESDRPTGCMDSDSELDSDDDIREGNFVIVQVAGKARVLHYVARVDTLEDDELSGVFLKKVPVRSHIGHFTFVIDDNDTASFPKEDVLFKLPQPTVLGGTARRDKQFRFPRENLEMWDLK